MRELLNLLRNLFVTIHMVIATLFEFFFPISTCAKDDLN